MEEIWPLSFEEGRRRISILEAKIQSRGGVLTRTLCPPIRRFHELKTRLEAEKALTRTAILIGRHRASHDGAFPATLSALRPLAGPDGVPTDPLAKEPSPFGYEPFDTAGCSLTLHTPANQADAAEPRRVFCVRILDEED